MTAEIKGRVLVTCQLCIVALLVLTTKWQLFNGIALGFYCASFSITVRALIVMPLGSFNIRPTLKRNAKLVTSGPYRYIRHPIYVGVLLFCGALVATSWSPGRIILLVTLLGVLWIKATLEEKILLASFPDYQKLQQRTGMFTPWF